MDDPRFVKQEIQILFSLRSSMTDVKKHLSKSIQDWYGLSDLWGQIMHHRLAQTGTKTKKASEWGQAERNKEKAGK